MKKVSKISALIAVVLILVGLTGCGEKPAQTPTPTPTPNPVANISTVDGLASFLNDTTDATNGKLTADITTYLSDSFIIPEGKTRVLDLNGYTLTKDACFYVRGNLTIKDSSSGKTGKITDSHTNVIIVQTNGKLTLESGTLEATGSSTKLIQGKGGDITIKGGVVKAKGCPIYIGNGINGINTGNGLNLIIQDGEIRSDESDAVKTDNNPRPVNVTITGGRFYSATKAINLHGDGTAEITGGVFTGPVGIFVDTNYTVTKIEGVTINASLNGIQNYGGTIKEIVSGTVIASGNSITAIHNDNNGTIENIKGGTFKAESSTNNAYGLRNVTGSTTVSGGNFSGTYSGSSSDYIGYGLYNYPNGTLTVTGGSFNGGSEGHGANYNAGTLNLSSSLSANSVFTPALTGDGTINQ